MRQSVSRTQLQSQLSRPLSICTRALRRRRVALSLAGAAGLLAGTLLASASADAAPSSTYTVTEVPFFCCATGVAADPATDTVYVAAPNDEVAVIDGATDAVTAQIGVTNFPALVAVDQASDTVYAFVQSIPATQYTPGIPAAAEVINGATDAITTTISLPSGLLPGAAAVNPVTHMIYVTDYANGTVVVIDGNTDTVAATISLADPVVEPDPDPWGLAVDSETDTVYVSDFANNQVAVIDGEDNTVTGRIAMPGGSEPTGVAVDPAAGLVYVADQGTGEVSVIDTATEGVSTLASGLTNPSALALDSESGTLYASASDYSMDSAGTTYVIDAASGAITTQIPRGGASIAIPASGGSVFVAGSRGGTGFQLEQDVTVITPSTANTMSPVIVGTDSLTFNAGQADQEQLTASATPAATFSATGLPDWLTLNSSGLLSGTAPPGSEGSSFVIAVTAANGIAPPYTADFYVTVEELPVITSADQATFAAGSAGGFTVSATGFPAPTFSETGTLPTGVAFSSAGVLSGTPAAGTAGSYAIQITATNSGGSATQAFTLIVDQPATYKNPAITWTGNAVLAAAADSSGNLDYWWQAAGTGVWNYQQVAAAGSTLTYADPSVTWASNAVLVTATDSSGNVDYWWQAAGTGVWHEQQVAAASGGVTYANPAITWTGNAVLITAADSAGNLDYWWQAAGTGVWHQQQVAAAATSTLTYANPAITWTGNAVLVSATDSSGNLDYWWQAAGTGIWHQQQIAAGTRTVTYKNPLITWAGNAVLVTAADSSGNVDYWWQAAGTGVWHEQQVAAATSTLTFASPAITWTGNAVLISAADSSGNLDYWWQAAGTGIWNPQQVAAATSTLTYASPAITWTGNAVLITAADSTGNLDYWWQASGTGTWNPQLVALGG
jgi:YVTN family beta-propeller protein